VGRGQGPTGGVGWELVAGRRGRGPAEGTEDWSINLPLKDNID
jgi:hypothetical protein